MEIRSLDEIHKINAQTFNATLFEPDGERSVACKIWDVMTDDEEMAENCLGENLNQTLQELKADFFDGYMPSEHTSLNFYFTTYLLWLYLFVERIDFVFDVVNKDGKSKLFTDFKHHNFPTSRSVKKWANFIKHPKEFLFSHWPQYVFENSTEFDTNRVVIIDSAFVGENYSKSNSKITKLENCDRVVVLLPELTKLTEDFCKELVVFFDFICDNRVVSDYLRKKTTIEDYYTDDSKETIESQ